MNIIEYDIRGQICPSCLLTVLNEINLKQNELRNGDIAISVKTNHRQSTSTIPEAAQNMGYSVKVEKNDGFYNILISK